MQATSSGRHGDCPRSTLGISPVKDLGFTEAVGEAESGAMTSRKHLPQFDLVAAILIFSAMVLPLQRLHSAEAPCPSTVPKMSDDWVDCHKAMVADATARAKDIQIVFAGDSITWRWTSGGGRKIWDQRYAPLGAINLSISADSTKHLLWRLQHGVLEPLHPKMVILLIGANNLSQDPEAAAYGVWANVSYLRKTLPDTRVLVQGIFRRENPPAAIPKAPLVNAYLAKLDDGKMVKFLDFSSKFLKPDGTLDRTNFPDGCHADTPEAFQIWADSIQPVIDEWLKAPPIANVPPPPSPVGEPADKSAAIPEPRNDALFRHKRYVARAAKGNCDLLFVGDTTMACWDRMEALTKKEYGSMHWLNFADWGSRTESLLWELNDGELEGIKPKVVVVQVQENLYGKTPAQDVAAGMDAIAKLIHQKLPDTKVLLLGAFTTPKGVPPAKVAEYNSLLAKQADGKSVYFLDVGKAFLNPDGTPSAGPLPGPNPMAPAAYEHWADAQRATIVELMAAGASK